MPKDFKAKLKNILKILSLVLFFSLPLTIALAALPTVGTITPSSGTGQVNVAQTFTATYSDSDGWQNIQSAYFLISTSSYTLTNNIYAYYNQNTNLLYLRDDANTAWLGGYTPGSSNTIENSYVKLNCSSTTISGSGTTLTINWSVTIKPPLSGTKSTYLYVKDDLNAYAGWTKVGSWSIPNQAPTLGTITPSSGSSSPNQAVTFTTTYSDPDGWLNIQEAYLLINTYISGTNCFYAYYHPVNNKLYLKNDANSSWLGGYSPGSSNTIENSYVKLDCGSTTVQGSGNTLTVNWSLTFKEKFSSRTNNCYLYVKDSAGGYQGYTQKGSWTILSANPQNKISLEAELAVLVSPFTVGYDTNASSSQYIQILNGSGSNLISPGGPGTANFSFNIPQEDTYSILARVIAPSTNDNSFFIQLDSGTALYWDIPVTVNWSWSQVRDTTIGIIYARLTPGTHTLYFRQREDGTKLDKLILINNPLFVPGLEDVTGADTTPPTGTIKINNDSQYTNSSSVTLSLSAQDNAGGSGMTAGAQMQFSNDGTSWSTPEGYSTTKAWTLTSGDGTKTVYVKYKDVAGNWSSAFSDSIDFFIGQTIGPEGGEVLSNDGKVKIVIPQGALTQSTQIKILSVDRENLESSTPTNTRLLSVVECKPYGLVFNKPVSIIYTLTQAEIPGTPVELGLYDSSQNKIISTGQTSTVPADGYTLTFSIIHFSTYAALKSLIPQSAPIGAYVKIPLPDMFTGGFSSAIPITVPPGRKGMQPSLALSYRSSNPNSWVGLGFSLNPCFITRSTRLGPPTYDDKKDTFYFITDSGTTELVNLIDNLYQAKIESSFTKFFKEADDSWKVVSKDGTTLFFGKTADSKETSTSGTFSWYLTKVIDTNSNYVSFSYTKSENKAYLSRIDYTGNEAVGFSPTNSVEFYLEPRTDSLSSYISTSKIATAKRLKEIQAKVNSELVWRYVLEYSYSLDTNRSLLKSITQLGSDGTSLPKQSFEYQAAK